MKRRRYIRTVGAAAIAAVAGLSGCESEPPTETPTSNAPNPTSTSPPPPRRTTGVTTAATTERDPTTRESHPRFESVVDMGQAGADREGGERVDGLVEEYAADDTLLEFPPGTYRIGGVRVSGVRNFGIVGEDATFVLDERGRNILFNFSDVADILVRGITVDSTPENTAAWMHVHCTGGRNVVSDYTVNGFGDVVERTNGLTLVVEGKDTSLRIERADLSDGALNGAATFVFPRRSFSDPKREAGALTFADCKMKGWGKEGLYGSAHSGPIRVVGGEYANNAIVQVRVGGGNAPTEALIRGVTIRVDDVPDYISPGNSGRLLRGIWLKEGDGVTVEDCDVAVLNVDDGDSPGGIVIHRQFGRATIRDTRIRMAVPRPAISIERPTTTFAKDSMPSLTRLPPQWAVTCERVDISATGTDGEAVRLFGRSNCEFRNLTVSQAGTEADGIYLKDAERCSITESSIVANRYPVVTALSGNLTRDACRSKIGDTRLVTSNVDDVGSRLAPFVDGQYCIDDRVMATVTGTGERSESGDGALALTRTDDSGLYGRIVDDYRIYEG